MADWVFFFKRNFVSVIKEVNIVYLYWRNTCTPIVVM